METAPAAAAISRLRKADAGSLCGGPARISFCSVMKFHGQSSEWKK
jgi:hypothetical protein